MDRRQQTDPCSPSAPGLGRHEYPACTSSGLRPSGLLGLLLLALSQPCAHCQMRTLKSVPRHSCTSEQCRRLGISFCTPTPLSHFLLSLLSQQGVGGCTRDGRDIISIQGEATPACMLFWDSSTMRRTWVSRDQALCCHPSQLSCYLLPQCTPKVKASKGPEGGTRGSVHPMSWAVCP